jgi:hypothetical protein
MHLGRFWLAQLVLGWWPMARTERQGALVTGARATVASTDSDDRR